MFCNRVSPYLRCPVALSMRDRSRYSVLAKFRLFLLTYILLAFLVCQSLAITCQYSKQKGLHTADCSHREFKEVPKNIRPETEVLDLSWNKIRELHNDSFICCTSIKLLYLQTNSIFSIDSHVFAPLTSLTALDLSENVLKDLPQNLPTSLVKLFLDQNPSLFPENVEPVLPISKLTSLDTLHLSSNWLKKFPKFNGTVPSLVKLNITDNSITNVSVDDLAGLCQLKYLYVKPDQLFQPAPTASESVRRQQFCACLELERWVTGHEIEVSSFRCKKDKSINFECNLELRNTTTQIYETCMAEVNARKLPYKLMVGSCIVVLLLGIIILLYVRHRRRMRKKSEGLSNNKNRNSCGIKHLDNRTMEENHERVPVEEDKLLKQ